MRRVLWGVRGMHVWSRQESCKHEIRRCRVAQVRHLHVWCGRLGEVGDVTFGVWWHQNPEPYERR
jgi:hypothetical protein